MKASYPPFPVWGGRGYQNQQGRSGPSFSLIKEKSSPSSARIIKGSNSSRWLLRLRKTATPCWSVVAVPMVWLFLLRRVTRTRGFGFQIREGIHPDQEVVAAHLGDHPQVGNDDVFQIPAPAVIMIIGDYLEKPTVGAGQVFGKADRCGHHPVFGAGDPDHLLI